MRNRVGSASALSRSASASVSAGASVGAEGSAAAEQHAVSGSLDSDVEILVASMVRA